ncbi:MAG: helix-turn-helix transcriptional regulator [Spirochaetales bacterium]|nr:helix-turn-helix transcriptional regulator [Spirochaetales bacterium]
MTEIAKFLRKLRIDNEQSLGDMAKRLDLSAAYLSAIENGKRKAPEDLKDNLFKAYNLSEEQKLEFARLVAESRKKVVIDFDGFQNDYSSEYMDTAVMFAHDLSQMNRQQLEELKKYLLSLKPEVSPM